jgi:hypothetical protein
VSAIRVYVNSRGIDVPLGATMLDAVRVHDTRLAQLVIDGERALTDSRGLPLSPDARAFSGAIVRVVSAKHRASEEGQ